MDVAGDKQLPTAVLIFRIYLGTAVTDRAEFDLVEGKEKITDITFLSPLYLITKNITVMYFRDNSQLHTKFID